MSENSNCKVSDILRTIFATFIENLQGIHITNARLLMDL